MDPKQLQDIIDGIKATENVEEIESKIEELRSEEKQRRQSEKSQHGKKSKDDDDSVDKEVSKFTGSTPPMMKEEEKVGSKEQLQMIRFNSAVVMPPNTVKTFGKRLYSPLTNVRKGVGNDNNRPYVIGICGGSCCGKFEVAKFIKEKLQPKCDAVILNLIHFYKPIRGNLRRRSRADSLLSENQKESEQIKSEIRDVYRSSDFDSPDAIDWDLLNQGVKALKNLQPFNKPIYDDETMIRQAKTEHIKPSSVIIIEGHLIFCNKELMKKMDLKIFIDTDDDVRLSRRVLKMSRKHPDDMVFLQDLLQKYENYVKPSFEKFVEPTKKFADIILPNYGFSTSNQLNIDQMNIPAIDLIIKRVLSD